MQFDGNDPIEDRMSVSQLKNLDGYYAAVFDGHGGWQVADFCRNNLHEYIDEELKGAKTDAQIKKAIEKGFDRVEAEWYDMAKTAFKMGFAQPAYVGACALVCIVVKDKLYVANAGDCKGVLYS